jgi:hypothetical protein
VIPNASKFFWRPWRRNIKIPANIILHLLPPYSPELNPQKNIWDEICEKIFKKCLLPPAPGMPTVSPRAAIGRYCCKSLRVGWVQFFPGRGGNIRKSKIKQGASVWTVGTWGLKAQVFADLRKRRLIEGAELEPAGACHFGEWIDEPYLVRADRKARAGL